MIKRLFACSLVACGSPPASPPPPPPPDHQLHVTETAEADGLRLQVTGTGVSLESLGLPDWIIVPVHGTVDVAVDLHMPHVPTRDFRVATGDASVRCTGCTLGGGHPPSAPGGGSDELAAFTFPTLTLDRVDARVVLADGHADLTIWSVESKDGDTLIRINGFDVSTADKALEVYTTLRDARSIELELVRHGTPVTLMVSVTPGGG